MNIVKLIFCILILSVNTANSYQANCVYEGGTVSGFGTGVFSISVNDGVLTQRFTNTQNKKPAYSTFTYYFKSKTDSEFCYSRKEYSNDGLFNKNGTRGEYMGEAIIRLGKFNNGKFSIKLSGWDGSVWGTCTLK